MPLITTLCFVPFPWARLLHFTQQFPPITLKSPLLMLWTLDSNQDFFDCYLKNDEILATWTHNLVIMFERERVQRNSLFVTTTRTHLYLPIMSESENHTETGDLCLYFLKPMLKIKLKYAVNIDSTTNSDQILPRRKLSFEKCCIFNATSAFSLSIICYSLIIVFVQSLSVFGWIRVMFDIYLDLVIDIFP